MIASGREQGAHDRLSAGGVIASGRDHVRLASRRSPGIAVLIGRSASTSACCSSRSVARSLSPRCKSGESQEFGHRRDGEWRRAGQAVLCCHRPYVRGPERTRVVPRDPAGPQRSPVVPSGPQRSPAASGTPVVPSTAESPVVCVAGGPVRSYGCSRRIDCGPEWSHMVRSGPERSRARAVPSWSRAVPVAWDRPPPAVIYPRDDRYCMIDLPCGSEWSPGTPLDPSGPQWSPVVPSGPQWSPAVPPAPPASARHPGDDRTPLRRFAHVDRMTLQS